MDGKASGRFLNGHSSGGWATLWLQVTYPKVFGGTWSTSPDSSDFHHFTGPDLYAENANVYRRPDGSAWPLVTPASAPSPPDPPIGPNGAHQCEPATPWQCVG